MDKNTCCFVGHRKIEITAELKDTLYNVIKNLIIKESIDTFLFGSKSQFNDLCYQLVSKLKVDFPSIKRVYVRANFPYIDDDYKAYLLQRYEETYYPDNIHKAGKSAYIKRNCEMINQSKFCIIYFDENYLPHKGASKSGTKTAYDYALKKQKQIINIFSRL